MIDEPTEEAASLYVFGLLEGAERIAFEKLVQHNPELTARVSELREAAASLAHSAPARPLPLELERRITSALFPSNVVPLRKASPVHNWIPWAIAAALLTACVFLYNERTQLRHDVVQLENQNIFAQAQIATLTSKMDSAPKATAVVIWNPEKQEGVLKVVDAPVNTADHDYQLWVVDPNYKQPVSAGVFGVDPKGPTRISFKPTSPVTSAQAFAISLERKGGVAKAEGPIVLIGK